MLAIHGRTRACAFRGTAEYDTIAEVKSAVRIPVVANGDIATPVQAKRVLAHTAADGVMIGRAAHGRPWIFAAIAHHLATGGELPEPDARAMRAVVLEHLDGLYALYGEAAGARIARKHIGWYVKRLAGGEAFRREMNLIESATVQRAAVDAYFMQLADATPPANDNWEKLAA
jgi:tRNA-dihydrouridine synthase B